MSSQDEGVDFRVLGSLEVHCDSGSVALGAPRVRAVLAILLTHCGTVVSVDRFVDELWPERPPRDARGLVHGYLSRLRRALRDGAGPAAADRLVTHKPGYVLRVADDELDGQRFDRLVNDARAARQAGDLARVLELFQQAHDLWRGTPFADVPATPMIAAEATRLTEKRLTTSEERFEAALDAGHYTTVVAEITTHLGTHPLREQAVGQLMRALHHTGRTADALQAFQRTKDRLAEELGIAPGPQLRQLHQAILRGELHQPVLRGEVDRPTVAAVPPPLPVERSVPAQLPVGVTGFTGRGAQLAQLDALLEKMADSPATAAIAVLSGTAGVGKTTLAVHWAHRVQDRFPDGQLYVNLRGFAPGGTPMDPAEAVRGFLDTLQVPPQRIPPRVNAQINLYRSLLNGRRMLVVFDNARDAEQVRPLLPGTPGCLVVVTSRDQLFDMIIAEGARLLNLDLLSDAETRDLLACRLGPDRLAGEPQAVQDIVDRCAGLPLALAIVAARAAAHPRFPLASLVDQIGEAGNGLDAFDGEASATNVRSVFSWSYQALSPGAARLFRLLGMHPGPDVSVPAAASLASVPVERARPLLAELRHTHLITEHAPGRYTFHDLLRAYAAELADEVESDSDANRARHRIFDHYLHTAHAVASLMRPDRAPLILAPAQPGVRQAELTDHRQAKAWLTAEHAGLLAAIDEAIRHGFDVHAWQLAWTVEDFLDWRGDWRILAATQRAGLQAAVRVGDHTGQARTHNGLARACLRLSRPDEAYAHLRQALDRYHEVGDDVGKATTIANMVPVLLAQDRDREALERAQQALELCSEGDRQRQARYLNNLGWCHALLGDYQPALTYCEQALALQRTTEHRHREAVILHSLGYVHHHLGHREQAIACYQQALGLFQDLDDRCFEADTLSRLGDSQHAIHDLQSARDAWQYALVIFEQLGHTDADQVRAKLKQLGR